jgi:NAD(P)-dependent dehydrogenase (short-subunit alcohol dehydrogenase family)
VRGDALEVTDREDVARAFAAAADAFGPVTGLINNAGVSIGATALETTPEVYRTVMGTNVDGVWNCALEFARRLPDEPRIDATILNVGSMSAEIVNRPRWQAPYLASKAAVHQLTKALAAEWADRGIRVNAIAPGYFLTEQSPVDQPEYYADCVAPAALKRYGLPEELGPAAVFLLSGASSFMTGSIVTIDGGYTLF